jgi:type I restriction enzyme S subunit
MSSDAMRVKDASQYHRVDESQQDVPPGYKRTEVGVIPSDWACEQLGAQCERITKGTTPTTLGRHFSDSGVLFLKAEAISDSGRIVAERVAFIDEDTHVLLSRSALEYGDLLISIAGVLGRVGRVVVSDLPANTNQALAIIRLSRRARVAHDFLFWCLKGGTVQERIRNINVQAAQANISLQDVREFLLPLPASEEQRAIAEALSDVDRLLGAFEGLIAKKRAIKQAAMQQLLTGKARLPGFSGEWGTKRLGRHVTFLRHGTHSRAHLTADGPVRNLHYGDIHTSTEVFLNARETSMPRLAVHRAAGLDRLEDGDLVLVDASEDLNGVGKSVELTGTAGIDVVSGLHTIAARFDKSVLADGFKRYLQFCPAFRQQLTRLAAGTKVYATNRAHIASVEMSLPHPDEQTAIATVLSDMDAEIAALEVRRDKTCAIKQGMMQQLLTGRVRLMKPEAAA